MNYFLGINKLTGEIIIPNSFRGKSNVYLDCMNSTDSDTLIVAMDNKLYSYKISTDTLTQILSDNLLSSDRFFRASNGDIYYSTNSQNLYVYKAATGTSTALYAGTSTSNYFYSQGFLYPGGNKLIALSYRYNGNYNRGVKYINLETYELTDFRCVNNTNTVYCDLSAVSVTLNPSYMY